MWTSSQVIFKDFNAIYVSFHMSKYGTYTFSFFVFALVKCIFCFSFSWIRKRTDNKTNCFFKNYICRSIFNYSLLFRIFFCSLWAAISCRMKLILIIRRLKRDLTTLCKYFWHLPFFDNFHKELHLRWRQTFSLYIAGS